MSRQKQSEIKKAFTDGIMPVNAFFDGDGGIRTLVPRRANAFRVRPVMTTSIRLLIFLAADAVRHPQLNYYSRVREK